MLLEAWSSAMILFDLASDEAPCPPSVVVEGWTCRRNSSRIQHEVLLAHERLSSCPS